MFNCWQETVSLNLLYSFTYFLIWGIVTYFRPTTVWRGNKQLQLEWDNTLVSLIHSFVSSFLLIAVVFLDEHALEMILYVSNSRILYFKSAIYVFTLCHTIGYMQYDLIMFFKNGWYKTSRKPMVVHHILIIFCFTLGASACSYYPILVFGLFAELNSLFMHLRKLYKLIDNINSKIYSISALLLVVTYVPFRILPHIIMTIQVWILRESFLHYSHFVLAFIGMNVLSFLNILFLFKFKSTDIFNRSLQLLGLSKIK